MKAKFFSLSRYLEECLPRAEYSRDENGIVITRVPGASGFFAQGDSFEEAKENLRDAIEGNVILALQLGFEIPHLEGIKIKKRDVQTSTS